MKLNLKKVTIKKSEMDKLTHKEKKQFLMCTLILKDIELLQKHLLFIHHKPESNELIQDADETLTIYFLTNLISKIYEMDIFFRKNGIYQVVEKNAMLGRKRKEINDFFNKNKTREVFAFIRNNFAFHYLYEDKHDKFINDIFGSISEFTAWLSTPETGNEIFSSSNVIIRKSIIFYMKDELNISCDLPYEHQLFESSIRGTNLFRDFIISYLREFFPIKWDEKETIQVEAPLDSEVNLPLIVAIKNK